MESSLDVALKLTRLAERILKAAKENRGCKLSAEECELLARYNLPCTADHPSIADQA